MALTLYGSPRSRTLRVLWMASELELVFEHIPYAYDDPALKTPEFLQLNPAGAIPTLVDDGVAVAESLAINLYLAKKYRTVCDLYADTAAEEAAIWQWSLFAQGHLEPWVQKDALLADLMATIGARAQAMVQRSLAVLERVLAVQPWLIGKRFTVADLNVAGVLSPSRSDTLDLTPHPHVGAWLDGCFRRPAAIATRRRFQ